MPSQPEVTPEQIREWQLSAVSQALHKKLQAKVEQAKGTRPFTDGNPDKTYSDLLVIMVEQDTLENLLPLFTADPAEVAEQLTEHDYE